MSPGVPARAAFQLCVEAPETWLPFGLDSFQMLRANADPVPNRNWKLKIGQGFHCIGVAIVFFSELP